MEDLLSTNLVGDGSILFNIVSFVFNMAVVVTLMALGGAILYFLFRFLAYSTDVEIWEKKGNDLVYFGDDRAKRTTKKGVSYISFLKNKAEIFKHHKYPDSDYLYKKRFFGTKIKYLINGDDLLPTTLKIGNPHGLQIDKLHSAERIDHLQRSQQFENDYNKKSNTAQVMTLVVGVTLIGILMFGLFVIWQSNVATSEANKVQASSTAAQAEATRELARAISGLSSIPAEGDGQDG